MRHNLVLTGDINLLGVTDPSRPFARVQEQLHAADVVFANLECCFYEPDGERSPEDEGFYAPLKAAEALTIAGVHAVGNANNVNYGAAAIHSSLKCLDELGILHTGAGVNSTAARQPVVMERHGVRFGFLQRTSVYWSHGHEATATYPGVATLKAHTASPVKVTLLIPICYTTGLLYRLSGGGHHAGQSVRTFCGEKSPFRDGAWHAGTRPGSGPT